jgi:DNA-binding PadR family transcriptional regulator
MSSEHTAGEARNGSDASYANKRLADLSAFQRDILWILSHSGPLKGLAIKAKLQEYYDENVNHGQLYPNLDELVDRGLVKKGKRDQRTNEYKLTAAGKQALSRRRTWTEAAEIVQA